MKSLEWSGVSMGFGGVLGPSGPLLRDFVARAWCEPWSLHHGPWTSALEFVVQLLGDHRGVDGGALQHRHRNRGNRTAPVCFQRGVPRSR